MGYVFSHSTSLVCLWKGIGLTLIRETDAGRAGRGRGLRDQWRRSIELFYELDGYGISSRYRV